MVDLAERDRAQTIQGAFCPRIRSGIASPSPEAYLVTGTESEESLGFELGYRYRRDSFNAEVVGFLTDFSQLIATDAGFGFTNTSQNAGEAQVYGLESIVQYDPGLERNLGFCLPMFDERKMVSRIPEGPRANAPRMLFGGVEITF